MGEAKEKKPETFITKHKSIQHIPISSRASLNCFLPTCLPAKSSFFQQTWPERLLLMLNIVRRGPASTVQSLLFRSSSLRCIRTTQARDLQRCISRGNYAIVPRPFGTTTKWRQFAAAATAVEAEAIQSEVEPTFSRNEPPSNA